jgi:hypothetical protein
VNTTNKCVALPNTNVMGSGKPGKHLRMDINARDTEFEDKEVLLGDITAEIVISSLDISRLTKGAVRAKRKYSSVGLVSFLTSRVVHELKCLLDAGANVNVLPLDFVQDLIDNTQMSIPHEQVKLPKHKPQARWANGESTEPFEYIYLPVLVERKVYIIPFAIFPEDSKAILGTPALQLISDISRSTGRADWSVPPKGCMPQRRKSQVHPPRLKHARLLEASQNNQNSSNTD